MSAKPTYKELEKRVRDLGRVERESKKTEEELAQIFSMSLDMICIADIKTATFIKVNPAFTEILGYSEKALLEKPFLDFVHPEDIDATRSVIEQELQSGGKVINFENRYRCKDGSYRWLSWVSHPNIEQGVTYSVARDITEWKKNEEALNKSKSLLNATGRMARVGGWELEVDTLKITWTKETYRIHDVPLDYKPSLQEAINFFHPEDRPKLEQAIQRALDCGEPYDMEIRFITAKGLHLWARTKCEPKLVNGKVVKLKGTFQDITERKIAEEALREKDAMLANIASQVPGMIYQFRMTPDGSYSVPYSSHGVKDIFGCTPEDVLHDFEPILNAIHPGDRDRLLQTIDESAKNMSQWICEYRVRVAGKPTKWVFGNSIPEKRPDGSIVWSGYNVDITERKKAEEALQASHNTFLTVLNSIDATIYVADMQTYEILFMNKYMVNSFGRDMTGGICWDAFRGESGPCPNCPNDRLVDENGSPAGVFVWHDQNPITGKWYINYDRAIKWTDGRIVRIQIATDITEMKNMENQLRQAQKSELIGNLAGGIAHDFNNILFPISGLSELLLEDLQKGTQEHENVEEILRAAKRGGDLVKQILAFSRQSEHKLIPIRVQQILKEVLKLIRATIPINIEINQDIQSDCGKVMADPTQIHQVVMNIVTNAFHAVEAQGGTITVQLKEAIIPEEDFQDSLLATDKCVVLSISDTGHGMSHDIMNKIFDPYFTTKEQGKGTGLGLAVTYGIIKEHKGDIKVTSKVGHGTTFEIYLPLIDETVDIEAMDEFEVNPTGMERILLVDDEEPIARIEKQMLQRLGYNVTSRLNTVDALETFKARPQSFDLVISDMSMPNMTGDQLAKKLLSIRQDVPVILCTGFSERINKVKAESNGIKGFLMKPIVRSDLAKMVRKVLDEAGR